MPLARQQLRQLGKNSRDAPRLVARKQLTGAMSVTQLFFEIHVGKGLPVQIFHDKTGVQFLDEPGLRKVALRHSLLEHARHPSAPVIGYAPDLVTNSAGTLHTPVPISPPKMDGVEPLRSPGAARLRGLAMHGVMRALIARWVALIAMLGLLALVIGTSRTPCVPSGMWHTLQMNCR